MKFEVTHPKIWKKLAEKNIPMKHKVQIYEKLGGAYRLGEDGGEQVFNKMTELLRNKMNEGDEKTPEEVVSGLEEMTMGDLERIADYANMIETRMKEGQQLSSWMYSQLTIALENLNSVHDAMDGNDGEREPMKEASYNVKADNAYQFINGATAVLGVYLRDEKLESGVKNTLQRVVKDLEGLRKYFFSRKDESVNEAPVKSTGEKIQNLNNRIKVLRDKISATKSPEQKKLHSDRLKNALQSLSNIKKTHSIK